MSASTTSGQAPLSAQREGNDGPSPYVLTAIFRRMHEWEKEKADHAAQVKALGMRKKIKTSRQRLAISGQQLFVRKRKVVKA